MGHGQKTGLHGYPLDRYDPDAYMLPYWAGGTVWQEAVMPLENPDGVIPDIGLLYEAREIISVRSGDLKTVYQPSRDYTLVDGRLHIPAGSAIAGVAHDRYYPAGPTDTSKRLNEKYGQGYIFFSEGPLMHTLQIAVTYTHDGAFDGPIPACKRDRLPKTGARLKNGEPLKLCVFGDSICVGGNSTGFVETPPFAKTWWQMVADKLQETYPHSAISLENPSVGGKRSEWGAEEAAARVGYGPDLCIIGFGMNDGSRNVPPETYRQNIQTVMAAARAGNPDCEFLLIATILPNREVGHFLGNQAQYLPVLEALETEGVAVADMTTFHRHLLTRKRYCDMSGNNVNHPNDFLARAYAHVIWQTLIGY